MPSSRNSAVLKDHPGRDAQVSFAVYLRIAQECAGGNQELIAGSRASIEESRELLKGEACQDARRSWSVR